MFYAGIIQMLELNIFVYTVSVTLICFSALKRIYAEAPILVFVQSLKHNCNGRFVVVCGDGEFIIYTALAWRNRSFGSALEFVWSSEGEYAVRESTSRVKIFSKNFQVLLYSRLISIFVGEKNQPRPNLEASPSSPDRTLGNFHVDYFILAGTFVTHTETKKKSCEGPNILEFISNQFGKVMFIWSSQTQFLVFNFIELLPMCILRGQGHCFQ